MATEDADHDAELATEQPDSSVTDDESETDIAEPSVADDESGTEVAGGLEENVAGALTYLLGFITGLVFYFVEEENEFVRFHAMQSTIVFGGLFGLHIVLMMLRWVFDATIPFVGWLIALGIAFVQTLIFLGTLVLWLLLMYKAYQGEQWSLPVVGSMAENQV
ncbi:DUF4870 domain-containing protein [Natronobeatus ordinarius]|uniref:DUF4870 domain-containing protein n=1 Tax=Natronobeatus ordinarius TaxID=2963433 RepID=UPI0020CFE203|nr:hypothetical protein [Natronobeatus ordinarius]